MVMDQQLPPLNTVLSGLYRQSPNAEQISTSAVQSATATRYYTPTYQQPHTPIRIHPSNAGNGVFSPLGPIQPSAECLRQAGNSMHLTPPVPEHGTSVTLHSSHTSNARATPLSQTPDGPALTGVIGTRSMQPLPSTPANEAGDMTISSGQTAGHGVVSPLLSPCDIEPANNTGDEFLSSDNDPEPSEGGYESEINHKAVMNRVRRANRRNPSMWKEGEANLALVEAYIALKGEYTDPSGRWKKGIESAVQRILQQKGFRRSVPSIRTQFLFLRSRWVTKEYLLTRMSSGFGWDEKNKRPMAPETVWQNIEKAHRKKDYAWHRYNSIPDLDAVDRLFEGSTQATGRFAQTLDQSSFDDSSDTFLSIGAGPKVKHHNTQTKRRVVSSESGETLDRIMGILEKPIRIENGSSDWLSKANDIWDKEFPEVDYRVRKIIKKEWVDNWQSAQMFVMENSSYRRFFVRDTENEVLGKRHRRDRSDASNDEPAGTKRRTNGDGSAVSEPLNNVGGVLNTLGDQLTDEEIAVLERLLQRQKSQQK